jgi:tripartite-type tricarboxylate transporter receptor subunit TctC
MRSSLASEDLKKKIAADGGEVVSSTPEEYGKIVDADEAKWSALIRKLDLKVE